MAGGTHALRKRHDVAEQTPNPQAEVDHVEASKIKRAMHNCIAMFIVFMISLFAFGKAPYQKIPTSDGYHFNFDPISCIAIAVGVFGLIVVLVGFRRILRRRSPMNVLGLLGCAGLTVHTILALFAPLSYGASPSPAVDAGGNPLFDRRGSERWGVNGTIYNVASTYYVRVDKEFQFTIEYPHKFGDSLKDKNTERALKIAFPLIEHAYKNDLHNRTSTVKLGEGTLVPSRIGVALFENVGQKTRGYKVALSLEQIKKRFAQQSAAPPTTRSTPPSR